MRLELDWRYEYMVERLMSAIRSHQIAEVSSTLDNLMAVSDREDWVNSALMGACCHGFKDIFKLLLAKIDFISARDKVLGAVSKIALDEGEYFIVKYLLSTDEVLNPKSRWGNIGLMVATELNNVAKVRSLLEGGANPNLRGEYGITMLIMAADNGCADIVGLLLDKGAIINARDVDAGTALMAAAQSNKLATARVLLNRGADLNIKNKRGHTALMLAARAGYGDMVALLANKADLRLTDNSDKTALMLAVDADKVLAVKSLLEAGDDWLALNHPVINKALNIIYNNYAMICREIKRVMGGFPLLGLISMYFLQIKCITTESEAVRAGIFRQTSKRILLSNSKESGLKKLKTQAMLTSVVEKKP